MDTETACCGEQRQLTWVVSEMGNWRAARIRCSAQRALAPEAVPGLPVSARTSAVSRFRRPVPGARLVRSADGAGKKEKEKKGKRKHTHAGRHGSAVLAGGRARQQGVPRDRGGCGGGSCGGGGARGVRLHAAAVQRGLYLSEQCRGVVSQHVNSRACRLVHGRAGRSGPPPKSEKHLFSQLRACSARRRLALRLCAAPG